MDIQFLSDRYAVSPQLSPADVAEAKALGFATLICNRPDGEAADQPTIAQVAEAASAQGLAFHVIPMSSPAYTPEQLAELEQILSAAPGKVLAYCRTGRRSTVIYQGLLAAQGA